MCFFPSKIYLQLNRQYVCSVYYWRTQQKFYGPKKQPQKNSQKKCLEPILEMSSVSDDNNNTRSTAAEQISIIFDGLNIDDNHKSNNRPSTENEAIEFPPNTQPIFSINMNHSSLLDHRLEENLDDSVILIEPQIEVVELLDDSFEGTITSMNFSALSTDDSTDEECEDPKDANPKMAWSDRANVRSIVIQQEYVKQKIVDTFFGSEPMTANLFEMFPDIEPELILRRKSSVHWTTPPRYSMLPKY